MINALKTQQHMNELDQIATSWVSAGTKLTKWSTCARDQNEVAQS